MARDELEARWRRLRRVLDELRTAAWEPDPATCPDAVVFALHAFYDLFEVWNKGQARIAAEAKVRGDTDGETAVALVYVRGAATHSMVAFEDGVALEDAFTDTFTDLFGAWLWQPVSNGAGVRASWYEEHVVGRDVLEPILAAIRWLEAQAEVAPETKTMLDQQEASEPG